MSLIYNGVTPTKIIYNGVSISKVIYNNVVVWQELPINTYYEFNYTGEPVPFVVPATGLYKLEAYGAQGGKVLNFTKGTEYEAGGKGGYTVFYTTLTKGATIYCVVGGQGEVNYYGDTYDYSKSILAAGGYNGGGQGGYYIGSGGGVGSGGGGATHFATITGELSSVGYDNKSKILCVAGGGGGAGNGTGNNTGGGGTGGGIDGGSYGGTYDGTGGSQTSGGGHYPGDITGSFGKGGSGDANTTINNAGGGGGFFGGGNALYYMGAGGGSGYIPTNSMTYNNTVYTNSTENGKREGDGYAKITFLSY